MWVRGCVRRGRGRRGAFCHAGEEGEVGFQGRPGEGTAEADAEGGGGGDDEGEAGERGGHGRICGGGGGGIGHFKSGVEGRGKANLWFIFLSNTRLAT